MDKIYKIHMKHLKRHNMDIFNGDLKLKTSEYSHINSIETEIYEDDLHIETFYTEYLPHENRFVSWCDDECQ